MKCEESLLKIDAYINGTLTCRELDEFLTHIKTCPECYEELETYYTIHAGMKYLEEESLESYNIPQMLKSDLKKKEEIVRKRHMFLKILVIIGLLIIMGISVGILLYLGRIELPELF